MGKCRCWLCDKYKTRKYNVEECTDLNVELVGALRKTEGFKRLIYLNEYGNLRL